MLAPVALAPIDGFPFEVQASAAHRDAARIKAQRAARAFEWLISVLGSTPELRLTIADGEDWDSVAPVRVYGMPQTWGDHVIVPAGHAPMFDDMLSGLLIHFSDVTWVSIRKVYGDPPDLAPFFDAVVAHELVHLWHEQTSFDDKPMWRAEFHANLGMVGYVTELEPDLLPIVTMLAAAATDVPAHAMPANTLEDMPLSFDNGMSNFGWYHLNLIHAAVGMWERSGADGFRAVFDNGQHPDLTAVSAGWPTR